MLFSVHSDVEEFTGLTHETIEKIFNATAQVEDVPERLHYSIAIVPDSTIAQLNKQYRGKDGPTDVLSFRYDDESAEIVLGAETLERQAQEYGHSVAVETAFMLAHGILHTLGWDHERSEQEAKEQRALEHKILDICGIAYAR